MLTIQENIILAPYTTFALGGPADFFCVAHDGVDIVEALRYARQKELPVFVLGGGSNVIFSDAGFRGLVVKVENTQIGVHENTIVAGAGALLSDVITESMHAGLAGLERMSGIPGTIGGAVRGNAGAFGTEIRQMVTRVMAIDTRKIESVDFTQEVCAFSYRSSYFKSHPHIIIVSVELALTPGNRTELEAVSHSTIALREEKHPQKIKCAGSFFMNPQVKDKALLEEFARDSGMEPRDGKLPAGWLIDHVGLRGKKIGGAQVSEIHPNYIINTGNATAEDIIILSSLIKQRVRTQLGIRLQEEPQLVGF